MCYVLISKLYFQNVFIRISVSSTIKCRSLKISPSFFKNYIYYIFAYKNFILYMKEPCIKRHFILCLLFTNKTINMLKNIESLKWAKPLGPCLRWKVCFIMFLSINVESLFTFKKHYWKVFNYYNRHCQGYRYKITVLVKIYMSSQSNLNTVLM